MKWFKLVRYVFAAVSLTVSVGCTTYVAKINKDEGYDKRIADTNVVWVANTNFQVKVTRVGQGYQPIISGEDKRAAQQGTAELLQLFAMNMPRTVSGALSDANVIVPPSRETTSTQLRFRPVGSDTDCAPLGCVSSLWVEVTLYDKGLGKVVWSGVFKVGAPFPLKNDEAVIEKFTQSLIGELKNSRLL